MLEFPDLEKNRWNIVRNMSECFLGTGPIGETWKFSKGGEEKVPQYALGHFLFQM